jgi:CRISPR-associated protein Cas1
MTWRSVVIANPARLSFKNRAMVVEQQGDAVSVPLEDIAVLVIDSPQVVLTSSLLSACASAGIVVVTVDAMHTPNGVLLPYLQHSRALRVMRLQLALSVPAHKRIWQSVVQQKLRNQAAVLDFRESPTVAKHLMYLSDQVRSGDPDNFEAQGAGAYFPALFYKGFTRSRDCFYNAALNYCYSIVRSALARSLVGYGFLPAFGVHHRSEQNAFNLADDLIEPYRPVVDAWVVKNYPLEPDRELTPTDKATLVGILHVDAPRLDGAEIKGSSTLLALIDATVISLSQRLQDANVNLVMPGLPSHE